MSLLMSSREQTFKGAQKDNKCDSMLSKVKKDAKREYASVKYRADFEHIENSDEACLGICMTAWVACFFCLGTMLYMKCVHIVPTPPPPLLSMPELKKKMRGRTMKQVWKSCEIHDSVDANVSCFMSAAQGLNLTVPQAKYAFVQMDCDRNFRVSEEEIQGALNAGRYRCERTTLAPAVVAGVSSTSTTTTSAQEAEDEEATTTATAIGTTTDGYPAGIVTRPDVPQGPSYFVDNSQLQSGADGLAYRSSAEMENLSPESAAWGSSVHGSDQGGNWVKSGPLFLPKVIQGMPVLVAEVAMSMDLAGVSFVDLASKADFLFRFRQALSGVVASAVGMQGQRERVNVEVVAPTGRRLGFKFPTIELPAVSEVEELPVSIEVAIAPPSGASASAFRAKLCAVDTCDIVGEKLRSDPIVQKASSSGSVTMAWCSMDCSATTSLRGTQPTSAPTTSKPQYPQILVPQLPQIPALVPTTTRRPATTTTLRPFPTTTSTWMIVKTTTLLPEQAALQRDFRLRLADAFGTVVEAFSAVDADSNGQLNRQEFEDLATSFATPMGKKEVDACFDFVDADGDKLVHYTELRAFANASN